MADPGAGAPAFPGGRGPMPSCIYLSIYLSICPSIYD